MKINNFLSIDVEDYFQVSAFEKVSPPETWDSYEPRVVSNTKRILDMLDAVEVKSTFFILGWVAQRYPQLVKDISSRGHEVASHGYGHRRVSTLTREDFVADITESKQLLEDITGAPVYGYRAPSYSISLQTLWAFDELLAAGYRYDSSVFPVNHDFYGIPDWPRAPFKVWRRADADWSPQRPDIATESLWEIPITTLSLRGHNLPIAGGGYFRLFPYAFTRWGLQRINRLEKQSFVFYLHPWEFDPQQPRMKGAGIKSCVRHYLNLSKTEERFRKLIRDFAFMPICELFPGLEQRAEELDCETSASTLAVENR